MGRGLEGSQEVRCGEHEEQEERARRAASFRANPDKRPGGDVVNALLVRSTDCVNVLFTTGFKLFTSFLRLAGLGPNSSR